MSEGDTHDAALASLTHSFGNLEVKDLLRKSKTYPMPSIDLVMEFDLLANRMTKCNRKTTLAKEKNVVNVFGAPVVVIAKLWELMHEHDTISNPKMAHKHLLWALIYGKQYPSLQTLASLVKMEGDRRRPDEKTLVKWIWIAMSALEKLNTFVILWENRKTNDKLNDCLAIVDCVDCTFQQVRIPHPTIEGKMKINKALYSKKLNGPGLRYEVATSLLSNHIVWISGPFLPGEMNDLQIFEQELLYMLELLERIEADDIYKSHAPEKVKCPGSAECIGNEEEYAKCAGAQGRCELGNAHIKDWRCLCCPYVGKGTIGEKMDKHRQLFYASCVVTQVSMEMGYNELWELPPDYD